MTTDPTARRGLLTAALGTALHAALLCALLAMYVSYVPGARQTFYEYGLMLPWVSQTVVRLSIWVGDWWWALAPVGLVALAADFAVAWWFGRSNRAAGTLWVVAVAATLGLFALLTVYAVEYPLMKLREGLAR